MLFGSVFAGALAWVPGLIGAGALVVRAAGADAGALVAGVNRASMAPRAMYICAAGRLAMRWASAGFFASWYTKSGPCMLDFSALCISLVSAISALLTTSTKSGM